MRGPGRGRPLVAAGARRGRVGIAGYQLAFFAAVADTGVAVGTVVALGSAPALAGLLARGWSTGRRSTGRWAACTALATAGVLLLVLSGGDAQVDRARHRARARRRALVRDVHRR